MTKQQVQEMTMLLFQISGRVKDVETATENNNSDKVAFRKMQIYHLKEIQNLLTEVHLKWVEIVESDPDESFEKRVKIALQEIRDKYGMTYEEYKKIKEQENND